MLDRIAVGVLVVLGVFILALVSYGLLAMGWIGSLVGVLLAAASWAMYRLLGRS